MLDIIPENFWWNSITGPSAMIKAAEEALSEGFSIILGVPGFTAWPDTMRDIIRGNILASGVYVTVFDVMNECEGNAEDFLLKRYDRERRYRSRLCSVQDYFMKNKNLGGHVFWLHNFRDKDQLSDWLNFCSKYPSSSINTGLFILDTDSESLLPSGRMKAVNYSSYVERYDTRIFASFLLDTKPYSRPNYTRSWKQYISVLSAMLCGNDAELAERLILSSDFTCEEPADSLLCVAVDFPGRCPEDAGRVSHRIWTAQVQEFFPMIELARARIIKNYKGLAEKLAFALSWLEANGRPMVLSDGKTALNPEDLDIGGLFHLLCQSNMIKNDDTMLTEYVSLLRTFRNLLAHMTPCSVWEVNELLQFERHYEDKL